MATAPQKNVNETKTAIMNTAEILMAEHGIHGVSLRSILAEAGANSASLHYHFGSREELIEAILARRGLRTDLRCHEMLDRIEARNVAPNVHDIVDAVIDPMVEMLEEYGEAGRRFLRFIARLQSDRTGIMQGLEEKHFPDINARLTKMIAAACPDLSKGERMRRATIMLDAMLQSLANADVMNVEWDEKQPREKLNSFVTSLKSFLAGGLAAPVAIKKETF